MIIEDVKIEFTMDKLDAVCQMLNVKTHPITEIRAIRAKQNILAETFLKLMKKHQNVKAQPPKKKNFGIRFKYQEADVLEEFLRQHAQDLSDPYNFALVNGIADKLHQKLA